ncbi:PTS IIA-like nitrogen-regulatory protein PtsN [Alteromonadaceae bacterium Bs31]|nr:PTS IIA-like nitrogen-regulatory protein PtsN [Alteromonadaceae bacterium Bs31]
MLTAERTRAKVNGVSKKRVLETLAQLFAPSITDADETTIFQNILGRERLGSTGIGHGIAVPHCRYTTGGETLCACLTLDEPIDFDAIDSEPVDIVFAMLVPEDAEDSHLQTLAQLAESLQDGSFTGRLRKCASDSELFQIACAAQN